MSGDDSSDKSFDPTPKKLEDARKKGEIARSTDLLTASAYAGLTLTLLSVGASAMIDFGTVMMALLDQAHDLSMATFSGDAFIAPMANVLKLTTSALFPVFFVPMISVVLAIVVQRALVFAPSKLTPKLSRISIIQNSKNKFGRSGLFEFSKSFFKLLIYSFCLAIFLKAKLPQIVSVVQSDYGNSISLLGNLAVSFLLIVVCISAAIGGIDAIWQHHEHIRKNMMSRKEVMDEMKESEGDPHLKQERRSRAQAVATAQMMGAVPGSDVIIVNPTHYAIALTWERKPGSAPTCIAKGVDEVAMRIREIAQTHGIPIHSDPPTARALHAVTELGEEISPEFYQAVAAAIRFADEMRAKAKSRVTI
ncbi:MAG: flagellar type III secretion system protein FlhB [Paracoccaceae bacterium]